MQKTIKTWKRYIKKEATAQEIKHAASEDGDSYPFSTKFWFDNHVFANATSLYHTYSLVIAETIEALLGTAEPVNHDHADTGKIRDAEHHATSIIKLIPYCLQPDMGGLGLCIVSFPGNLALRYFLRTGDHVVTSWLTKVFSGAEQNEADYEHAFQDARIALDGYNRVTFSPETRSESSDETSELSRKSTPSGRRPSHVMVKFVYEDPSRHYTDMTGDPSQIGKISIRCRQPP